MIKAQIYPQTNFTLKEQNWYWRIKSHNGKILADGAEGYSTKANCKRAFDRFMQAMVNLAETNGSTIHRCLTNITIELPVEILDHNGNVVKEY